MIDYTLTLLWQLEGDPVRCLVRSYAMNPVRNRRLMRSLDTSTRWISCRKQVSKALRLTLASASATLKAMLRVALAKASGFEAVVFGSDS